MQGSPADQAFVRKSNLELVLRTVASSGEWSRAKVAAQTGLTKATVSSLVSELIDHQLLLEGRVARGGVGRPGQIIELDRSVAFFVGAEVNVDYVTAIITDLTGTARSTRRLPLDVRSTGPAKTLARMAKLITEMLSELPDGRRILTVDIAIPGLIDAEYGVLSYAPNLGWRDVDITHTMESLLRLPGAVVSVDNDANYAAWAEFTVGEFAGARHLVTLTGETGIGGGVIANGEIMRGSGGFFGEVGHMAIGPDTAVCGCGRRGCWEAVVGLSAALRALASDGDDELLDPHRDVEARLRVVEERADNGDPRTLEVLQRTGTDLGRGASVLINLLNPEVVIFGGYIAQLARFLRESLIAEVNSRVITPNNGGCRIGFSALGFAAAATGGAHAGIESLIADPNGARWGGNAQLA